MRWAAEAQFLHRQLLGGAAPRALEQAYVQAHQLHAAQVEPCCLPRLMQLELDVEAVELALRRTHPALGRKIHWLFTLAELHTNLHETPPMHPLRAAWVLLGAALITVYKRLQGAWWVRRYRLV